MKPPATCCAVYPGSFDPPTLGHLSLIERGLGLFEHLIVAVATNPNKATLFSPEERVEMIKESLGDFDPKRVEVVAFHGLLIDYVRQRGAGAILRGLRATADFEYEFKMSMINSHLASEIQSVFLMADYRWLHLSSTIVKEVASFGADIRGMVPPSVATRLVAKLSDS